MPNNFCEKGVRQTYTKRWSLIVCLPWVLWVQRWLTSSLSGPFIFSGLIGQTALEELTSEAILLASCNGLRRWNNECCGISYEDAPSNAVHQLLFSVKSNQCWVHDSEWIIGRGLLKIDLFQKCRNKLYNLIS